VPEENRPKATPAPRAPVAAQTPAQDAGIAASRYKATFASDKQTT
jgi:hypothetical protein